MFIFVDGETEVGKINYMSRYIIVHSLIYYEFNSSIISDYEFDMKAKWIYKYIQEHYETFIISEYYCILKDFNGCSGFDICNKLKTHRYYKMLYNTAYSLINKKEER